MPDKLKKIFCYENWFADVFAPLWINLDCTCCAFWRGAFLGSITFLSLWIIF